MYGYSPLCIHQSLRVLFQAYCESNRHKIDEGCYESPDSMLSDQTKGFFHSNFMWPDGQGASKAADTYLYNLRHPVDRMLSWYNYEHPQSCLHNSATIIACRTAKKVKEDPKSETALFFQTCFPRQQLLPVAFDDKGTNTLKRTCHDLVRKVFAGKMIERFSGEGFKPIQGFKHISFNMRYYTGRTIDRYPNKNVLILRTESLWDDLKDLDTQLGGYGVFGQREGYKDSHGSENYRQSKDTLSAADYGVLCCALLDEMNIYRDLLKRAVNFDDAAKNSTITSAANKCGFSSWNDMVDQCRSRQDVFGMRKIPQIDSTTSLVPESPIISFDDITFVDVGKAERDALNVMLKTFCESNWNYFPNECSEAPNSLLSTRITGYVHGEELEPSQEAIRITDAFFYILGHPVDHLASWYHFEHPQSCKEGHESRLACKTAKVVASNLQGEAALFFYECFPTPDLLSLAFSPTGSGSPNQTCIDLARRVVEGRISGNGFKHIAHNMRFFANRTIDRFQGKSVLVVRTETLWDDLKDLDFQLGGSGTFGPVDGVERQHEHEDVFSTVEYGLLCCAIIEEMQTYRRLLELAVNLDDMAKEATISGAAARCGYSSWGEMVDHCTGQQH